MLRIPSGRGVTPGNELRLSRFLGTAAVSWTNLQLGWNLYHARISEADVIREIAHLGR